MSEENVEIVRRAFEALDENGVEGVLPFLASDVIFYPFPEWVEADEYRGHDGIRDVLAVWTQNFDEFTIEVDELRDAGARVVALYEQSGRTKDSGIPVRQRVGGVFWDFRRGEIGKASYFLSWDEAREAAGLSE
jgi:ketosteroid isomerase-like protein